MMRSNGVAEKLSGLIAIKPLCNECPYIGMRFPLLCPFFMSGNAIHILNIFLELFTFFPFVMQDSQNIAPLSHTKLACKLLSKFSHLKTMFFIALETFDLSREILFYVGYILRYSACQFHIFQ